MEQSRPLRDHRAPMSSAARPVIGLMMCRPLTDSRAFLVWSGAPEAARQQNLNVICFPLNTHDPRDQDNILLNMVSQRRVQGIALYHWWSTLPRFEANIAQLPLAPIVSITHLFEGYSGVINDNSGGMRLAGEHLMNIHVRRRLAYIHGPNGCHPSEERFRASVDVLAEHGIPMEERLIVPRVGVTQAHGTQAVTVCQETSPPL